MVPYHHLQIKLWVGNAVSPNALYVLRRGCLKRIHALPKHLELLVLFQFLAGLLSTEPTVALVDTVVTDSGICLPNLSFHIVRTHVINAPVAP